MLLKHDVGRATRAVVPSCNVRRKKTSSIVFQKEMYVHSKLIYLHGEMGLL